MVGIVADIRYLVGGECFGDAQIVTVDKFSLIGVVTQYDGLDILAVNLQHAAGNRGVGIEICYQVGVGASHSHCGRGRPVNIDRSSLSRNGKWAALAHSFHVAVGIPPTVDVIHHILIADCAAERCVARQHEVVVAGSIGRLELVVDVSGGTGRDADSVARAAFAIYKHVGLAIEIGAVVGDVVNHLLPLTGFRFAHELHGVHLEVFATSGYVLNRELASFYSQFQIVMVAVHIVEPLCGTLGTAAAFERIDAVGKTAEAYVRIPGD